jgi:plastocyanin
MILAAPLQLAALPLASGEPSKAPFYVLGAVFAAWAVTVSVLGLRSADFPGTPGRARLVMGISIVLALSAVSVAVATSGKPEKKTAKTPAPGGAAGASTLALAADPSGQIRFDTNSLQAKAGRVTIRLANQSQVPHNVTLQTASGTFVAGSATVTSASTTLSTTLKPGTYTYYCSVDSHEQLGMKGTLVVS